MRSTASATYAELLMNRIRVATLNIWNKSGPWRARLPLIRSGLRALAPDLVGLQEVLRLDGEAPLDPDLPANQALELAEGLGYESAYGEASDYGHGLKLGNALLSRFPIEHHAVFGLPGHETGETRSLLHARVRTPLGVVPVFVTHLNWRFHQGSVRMRQVREIVRRVHELSQPDHVPAVLMGDFNAEPESDEMRYLRGLATVEGESVFFGDAWIYGGDGGPGYTFDRRNGFAALAHEPPRRLDYILVHGAHGKPRFDLAHTRVVFDEPVESAEGPVWPSDHFGVMTELGIRPEYP